MWEDTELVTLGLETAITSFSASAGGSGKLLFFPIFHFTVFQPLGNVARV